MTEHNGYQEVEQTGDYGPPHLAHMNRIKQVQAIRRMFTKDTPAERQLAAIKDAAERCQACPLHQGRTQAVAGSGPADATIMLVGEAPGREEDKLGIPFTGQAGQLLEGLLARAGTNRSQVFITNVLKCRPPENRDPKPEEAAACRPYLERQTAAVNPKIIVPLGKFSAEAYLPDLPYKEARGKLLVNQQGQLILPIMHPAAALRRREWRKELVEGFAKLERAVRGDIVPEETPEKRAASKSSRSNATPEEQKSLL